MAKQGLIFLFMSVTASFFYFFADPWVITWVYGHQTSLLLPTTYWEAISILGKGKLMLIVFMLVWCLNALWLRDRSYDRFLKQLLIGLLVAGLLSSCLKIGFGRDRPDHWVQTLTLAWQGLFFSGPIVLLSSDSLSLLLASSFPSGHSATAASSMLIVNRFLVKNRFKVVFITVFVLVAVSRIFLLRHFPSDVIVGAWIGWLAAKTAVCLTNNTPLGSI